MYIPFFFSYFIQYLNVREKKMSVRKLLLDLSDSNRKGMSTSLHFQNFHSMPRRPYRIGSDLSCYSPHFPHPNGTAILETGDTPDMLVLQGMVTSHATWNAQSPGIFSLLKSF